MITAAAGLCVPLTSSTGQLNVRSSATLARVVTSEPGLRAVIAEAVIMSVRIKLRPSQYEYYTNFDVIQGTIELNLASSESVSSIVVKMEGMAKSLCYTEPGSGKTRSKTPIQEIHKVLYLTNSVFPDEALRKGSSAASFTLPPGTHSWPFKFQIPINNDCRDETKIKPSIGHILQGPYGAKQRHVQQILPPSMSGSEEVWVKYFVKVTVARPSMLALNHREFVPFIFLPIEAPRAEPGNDSLDFFVKRQHTLTMADDPLKKNGLKGFFADGRKRQGDTVAIEVRMPNPPCIVPGLPVAMDIMGFLETNINMNRLEISKVSIWLCISTKVRASGLKRVLGTRVQCYNQDFRTPLVAQQDPSVPAARLALLGAAPFIVATDTPPTFSTCNIARTYELEVQVTLTHTGKKQKEMVMLTCPLTVLSGVHAPPPQEHVSGPGQSKGAGASDESASQQSMENDLPSYTEAVQVGAPSSRPRVPIMTSRTALRTRTSYRVGQDYYQQPGHEY